MHHTEFCVNLTHFLSGWCQVCVPFNIQYCASQNLNACYFNIAADTDLHFLFLCMDSRDKGKHIDVAHLF